MGESTKCFSIENKGILFARRGRGGREGHPERFDESRTDESRTHKASSASSWIQFACFGEFLGAVGGRKKGAAILRTGREEGQVAARKKEMSKCRLTGLTKDNLPRFGLDPATWWKRLWL